MELVSAVFDLIFAEGVEIILKFCISLLKTNEEALCAEKELDKLLDMLKNDLYEGGLVFPLFSLTFNLANFKSSTQSIAKETDITIPPSSSPTHFPSP